MKKTLCFKNWAARLLLLLPLVALTACSKTVQWEEEVPLNTGETIWVKRSMPWVYKGGMGNPFDMSMKATFDQTISFKHAGKNYSHTSGAGILWIAISPTGIPVLIADPTFSGWGDRNMFACVVPYYIQFMPDETGEKWTWPEKIEPWLYNLPANLMVLIPQISEVRQERYTAKERDERDASFRKATPSNNQIDPYFDGQGRCKQYETSKKPTWSEK